MSEDDDLPRLLSGRYRLEARLGHGGMGVVYRAVDLLIKRAVAVKLIRGEGGAELDEEVAGRFLREAKNTARLQNEHIVEVFDLGRTDDGGMYFVMELLEGESLSARLRRDGHLSPETTVRIARQICEALEVAHAIGVIHRDLKPANIMLLDRAGLDDYVKVLDFGVSKSYSADQETQLTQTGMLVGTVDYMAPEQIMGKQVDGRADVYSLGVVLYKMLCGKAPFKDNGVPSLIHAHLNTTPKPLIEVMPGIPNDLDRVVLRCMMKAPERRYESMAEVSRALFAALYPEAELVDLEYGRKSDSDPYAADDQRTRVGRLGELPLSLGAPPQAPPQRRAEAALPSAGAPSAPPVPGQAPAQRRAEAAPKSKAPPAPPSAPSLDPNVPRVSGAMFEDATIKMDRPIGLKKQAQPRPGLPMTPRNPANRAGAPPNGRPPLLPGGEPRVCASCKTANAPQARVCASCGVSLMAPGASLPPLPPPSAHALGHGQPVRSTPPQPYLPAHSGAYGVPPTPPSFPTGAYGLPGQPSGPPAPPPGWGPQQPQPEPSMWERFLTWTGIKTR